ncbi:sialate O-acetylesterase [Mucilaginibacter aquaedulcis]|uniref:sialate O-acetylesterase n=1 Tax=Mucilaginibacter aquaedulcis TaxID=1187081 RepID=UPI0025B28C34|nr:sialate O-acetylesterase [Mucilaginibacter aquaedulcis]MDN3548280.1 sialate O-acetylesterase [Mucilaginibacter aquaedulcis]
MKTFKYLFFLVIGITIGIVANRNREYLINAQFIRNHWHFRKPVDDKNKIINSDKVMFLLAFGQSNSANYGMGNYVCKNEVYNYYKGELYKAQEPLLGPEGPGSSVWTRVADMLIDSGIYKKVIIVGCGIGSTPVNSWAEGSSKKVLEKTLDYLKKDNLKLTHILWEQGETDNANNTTKTQYKKDLKNVISIVRQTQPSAPFFVSITSYFPYGEEKNILGIDTDITQAQLEVIKEGNNIKQGPNTDSLNLCYYRYNDLHFTEHGLDKLAYKWFKQIKANQ